MKIIFNSTLVTVRIPTAAEILLNMACTQGSHMNYASWPQGCSRAVKVWTIWYQKDKEEQIQAESTALYPNHGLLDE